MRAFHLQFFLRDARGERLLLRARLRRLRLRVALGTATLGGGECLAEFLSLSRGGARGGFRVRDGGVCARQIRVAARHRLAKLTRLFPRVAKFRRDGE